MFNLILVQLSTLIFKMIQLSFLVQIEVNRVKIRSLFLHIGTFKIVTHGLFLNAKTQISSKKSYKTLSKSQIKSQMQIQTPNQISNTNQNSNAKQNHKL